MLRADYKGLALLIHSFTAAVWQKAYPEINFMTVQPDGNDVMRNILLNEFKAGELGLSKYYKLDDENEKFFSGNEEMNMLADKFGADILINIADLAKRFLSLNNCHTTSFAKDSMYRLI